MNEDEALRSLDIAKEAIKAQDWKKVGDSRLISRRKGSSRKACG